MYVHMYGNLFRKDAYIYIHTYMYNPKPYIYIYIYIYIHICMYVHMYGNLFRKDAYIYIHTYMYNPKPYIYIYTYVYVHTYKWKYIKKIRLLLMGTAALYTFLFFLFFDGYCSTVQGLLDWFGVDLGFTELSFIQIDLCEIYQENTPPLLKEVISPTYV